MVLIQKQAF